MKPDEAKLLQILQNGSHADPWPEDVAKNIGMARKRLYYILGKWTDRDIWEYGVSLRTGWLTPKGRKFNR